MNRSIIFLICVTVALSQHSYKYNQEEESRLSRRERSMDKQELEYLEKDNDEHNEDVHTILTMANELDTLNLKDIARIAKNLIMKYSKKSSESATTIKKLSSMDKEELVHAVINIISKHTELFDRKKMEEAISDPKEVFLGHGQ